MVRRSTLSGLSSPFGAIESLQMRVNNAGGALLVRPSGKEIRVFGVVYFKSMVFNLLFIKYYLYVKL